MILIVWDLDGCLYASRHLYPVFRANTARAGLHLGLKMSFEEALAINVAAQERGELFPLSYIDDYGIPLPDLHRRYHDTLSETIVDPVDGLAEAFSRIPAHHAILSHGNRDWIERVLGRLRIRDFFDSGSIFALEDTGFILKTQDETPFLRVQNRLGFESKDIVMAEDTSRNLIIPHGIGWGTSLLHHNAPHENLPAHIHVQHRDPIVFIDSLLGTEAHLDLSVVRRNCLIPPGPL
ncbi:MAG TPA: hypothetical protein PKX87_01140 [Alphaproteobacteria bacterium]|nr:hypothetical protein [Alphaproteobacteria bacterium]